MRDNVCDLIYLDTRKYVSLHSLEKFYRISLFLQLAIAGVGIAGINYKGVSWKSLFPIVTVIIWSVLYLMFVRSIKSRKHTFELRFFVNGVSGLFLPSLCWLLYTSFNLVAEKPMVDFAFCLWLLLLYLLFSALYIGALVLGVHKGVFKKIKEKGKKPIIIAISSYFTSMIPISGFLGIRSAKRLVKYASVSVQHTVITVDFILILFMSVLTHINFLQYYYCKKYQVLCDENGNTTSPKLDNYAK